LGKGSFDRQFFIVLFHTQNFGHTIFARRSPGWK
jgi:hypothetical protein